MIPAPTRRRSVIYGLLLIAMGSLWVLAPKIRVQGLIFIAGGLVALLILAFTRKKTGQQ